jgi:hypothetical protein
MRRPEEGGVSPTSEILPLPRDICEALDEYARRCVAVGAASKTREGEANGKAVEARLALVFALRSALGLFRTVPASDEAPVQPEEEPPRRSKIAGHEAKGNKPLSPGPVAERQPPASVEHAGCAGPRSLVKVYPALPREVVEAVDAARDASFRLGCAETAESSSKASVKLDQAADVAARATALQAICEAFRTPAQAPSQTAEGTAAARQRPPTSPGEKIAASSTPRLAEVEEMLGAIIAEWEQWGCDNAALGKLIQGARSQRRATPPAAGTREP